MTTVTRKIKEIKQPRGGYLNPKEFKIETMNDEIALYPIENIGPGLVGLAVDYLTRFMIGSPVDEAFDISFRGAMKIDEGGYASQLLREITGLDNKSITNACKLTGYDVWYRARGMGYIPVQEIFPDLKTVSNIRIMVNRSQSFMKKYGPVVKFGFTFQGGYTKIITGGDGDFMTEDTLWDFKVSSKSPTSKNTLQILMYYLMGTHSTHKEFQNITKLGFYNPRLNNVYTLDVSLISPIVMQYISSEIIGYKIDDNFELP
jgi:hypothetical protein